MIDYEAIARRALDVPLGETQRANLRVWADQLEAAGDPRGALIALEHAMLAEPARRRVLRKAAHDHVVAHGAGLLGPLLELASVPHAIQLDWRAGQLYGVSLDARHASKVLGRREVDVLALVFTAPVASDLRRLAIRARDELGKTQMLAHAVGDGRRPSLEELILHTNGAPRTAFRRTAAPYLFGARLIERYPALRLLIDELVHPWPATGSDAEVRLAEPATKAGRALLGRALFCARADLRRIALDRIQQVGPRAFALVDSLMILLRSDAVAQRTLVARALAAIGAAAGSAWQALASISGRTVHSQETRRAAGLALSLYRTGQGLSSPGLPG